MVIEKIGWNKEYKNISFFLEIFLIAILIICLTTRQNLEVLIVIGSLSFFGMFLFLYLNIYCINIYNDKLIIKSIFTIKKYEFKSIIVESGISVRILSLDRKEILRIPNFIDPESKIDKAYIKYCKVNNIKHINNNNKITYNLYIKYFAVFGIIFSFILFSFSAIFVYLKMVNIYDDIIMILILLIFGIIILIPTILGILSYVNFEIIIDDNTIVIKNFIGVKRAYDINNSKCKIGKYIYKLKVTKHKIIKLPYYLVDNITILNKIA